MRITRWVFILSALLVPLLFSVSTAAADKNANGKYLVYIGTYTGQESKGIYAYRFDVQTGKSEALGLAAETTNPSFLAIHPNHKFLYAVNEISNYEGKSSEGKPGGEKPSGGVSSFVIDPQSGKLTLVNEVASLGADPCHVSLDNTGKYLLVANYTGGNVAVFPVLEDGQVGKASAFVQHTGSSVNPRRQESAHAHWFGVSPDNRFAIAADLGLDQLIVYPFTAHDGSVMPKQRRLVKLVPGAGPRHFVFHPNGKFAYVISELYSTITGFSYDAAKATLHEIQTISALPKDFEAYNDAAEIAVHPSGRFLYSSNRGHDSIAVFSVNADTGMLKLVENVATQGKTPRNFAIDPTGAYLFAANQNSNNVVVFRIDPETGRLTPTGQALEVPSPVSVTFMPAE